MEQTHGWAFRSKKGEQDERGGSSFKTARDCLLCQWQGHQGRDRYPPTPLRE